MGATVVSGVDAPPVLEAAEHGLDFVALFVEDGVVGDRGFPVDFEGMQGTIRRLARAARNQSAS